MRLNARWRAWRISLFREQLTPELPNRLCPALSSSFELHLKLSDEAARPVIGRELPCCWLLITRALGREQALSTFVSHAKHRVRATNSCPGPPQSVPTTALPPLDMQRREQLAADYPASLCMSGNAASEEQQRSRSTFQVRLCVAGSLWPGVRGTSHPRTAPGLIAQFAGTILHESSLSPNQEDQHVNCSNLQHQPLRARVRRHSAPDAHWRPLREAASGKTFPTYDPSTGEVLAQVAEGGWEDINRAVTAARTAFETGPWRKMTASERGRLIWKLGDCWKRIWKSSPNWRAWTTASRSRWRVRRTCRWRPICSATWRDGRPRSKATRFPFRCPTRRERGISLTPFANRSAWSGRSSRGTFRC